MGEENHITIHERSFEFFLFFFFIFFFCESPFYTQIYHCNFIMGAFTTLFSVALVTFSCLTTETTGCKGDRSTVLCDMQNPYYTCGAYRDSMCCESCKAIAIAPSCPKGDTLFGCALMIQKMGKEEVCGKKADGCCQSCL